MTKPDLRIDSPEKWYSFRDWGLRSIVDPMVFRTADMFLRGRSGVRELMGPEAVEPTWQAISENLGSLVTFFDRLILERQLPIVDYGHTFDSNVGYDPRNIVDVCNNAVGRRYLVTVHVMDPVYSSAKAAAIKLLGEVDQPPDDVKAAVLDELSAFDHSWRPNLGDATPDDPGEHAYQSFVFGGLLFAAYARDANAAHVIQPKRDSLLLSSALGLGRDTPDSERRLLDKLVKIFGENADKAEIFLDSSEMPLVLPHLLSQDPAGPRTLLDAAVKLRESGPAGELRAFLSGLHDTWKEKERLEPKTRKQLHALANRLRRDEGFFRGLKASLRFTWLGVTPAVGVPLEPAISAVMGVLPGRRHLKLLHTLLDASELYGSLDAHLKKIWERG